MKWVGHQPEFLPWLGFWSKLSLADAWLVFDHVQYQRRYFLNRNRIATGNGPAWIRTPVLAKGRFDQPIADVRINGSESWQRKLLESVRQSYRGAPYFADYFPTLEEIVLSGHERLAELNLDLARAVMGWLGIEVPLVRGSEIAPRGRSTEMIAELCEHVGATSYVSGAHGRDYLDLERMRAAGVEVLFHEFRHPTYPRSSRAPFVEGLSVLDLLFHRGAQSRAAIEGCGRLIQAEAAAATPDASNAP